MAATVNITLDQGSVFTYTFQLQGTASVNIQTSNAYASMKTEYDSTNSVAFSSNLVGANLTISMTANVTANLTAGTWVYDAILVDSTNTVERVVQGRVTVTPQVTLAP